MSNPFTNIVPSSSQPSQSYRLLTPKTRPVPLLSDPIGKPYSYGHTAWLLIYYYLRSGALVETPLANLVLDLLPLAVGQVMFCIVCLPAAGTWFNGTNGGKIIEGTASTSGSKGVKNSSLVVPSSVKKRVGTSTLMKNTAKSVGGDTQREVGGSISSRILPAVFSLILSLLLPPAPIFLLALIMGAPLYPTSLLPHTMLLAIHVSLLAMMPIFYSHGVSRAAWRDVAAAWLPFDDAGVWGGTVGTFVGGWIGAIPMALDWDRDWQKWPCTVLWGAVLGWGVGRLLTNVLKVGIGKRINFSEREYVPQLAENRQQDITNNAEKKDR